jgi:hypothetical protein
MRTAAGWIVIGVLLLGIAARPLPAAQPPAADRPSDPAVAALIADLGHGDYQVREKAGRALAAMGPKVLPDLRRALDTTQSPEAARRLTLLIQHLEHDGLVAPRRVTFTAEDRAVKDVLDEIARQSGYRVEFGGGRPELRASVRFVDTPFWEAIDRVAVQAGLIVNPGYDDEAVHLYPSTSFVCPFVAYSGPFRVVAQNISLSRNLQLAGLNPNGNGAPGNNRQQEYLNLGFQVFSEPKNPLLGTNRVEVVAAVDDVGASMVPPRDPSTTRTVGFYPQGFRTHNTYGNLNLTRGGRDATTIKSLKGRIGVMLLAGVVPDVVIPAPLTAKDKTVTGRTAKVELRSVTDGVNGTYDVALTLTRVENDGQPDWIWMNSLWQKLEMEDEKGQKYRPIGPREANSLPGGMKMTVQFGPDTRAANPPKLGPPVKLILNEWQSVTEEVAFEFKDVPLP